MMTKRLAWFVAISFSLGCGSAKGTSANTPVPRATASPRAGDECSWTPAQERLAWAITSVYENSTTVLQYQYCENINDGRGYTSGRAGFCTGTGDAVEVIACFDKALAEKGLSAHDRMSKYTRSLQGLKGADTAPVDRLGSYCSDWTASATDPLTAVPFKDCQDRVVSRLYQEPACRAAGSWGITSPLFLGELYDAWINHGSGDELLDSAGRATSIRRTGTALSRGDESALLHAFLTLRLEILRKDSTWALAVDRVAPFEAARRTGNFDFSAPIDTAAKSAELWPGMGLVDSKAPSCRLTLAAEGAMAPIVTGDRVCTAPDVESSLPGQLPVVR